MDKLKKRKNLSKTTKDWFHHVLYIGNMGINRVVRIANKFLEVQKSLKGTRKYCIDFLRMYESTYPKIEAILKLPKKTWENELTFKDDDHWLVDMWKMNFEN